MPEYQIDFTGIHHDRPCVRRLADNAIVTQAYRARTKLELVQVNGRWAVDVWLWAGGYHKFHSTHYLP